MFLTTSCLGTLCRHSCGCLFLFLRSPDGGAAYGTAKAGMGIGSMGVMHPQLVMRNIIPVVMAGVLGIYGLIVSVILLGSSERSHISRWPLVACLLLLGASMLYEVASCPAQWLPSPRRVGSAGLTKSSVSLFYSSKDAIRPLFPVCAVATLNIHAVFLSCGVTSILV